MSKPLTLVVVGLLLVAIGFGAGRLFTLRASPMAGIHLPKAPRTSDLAGKSAVLDALLVPEPFHRYEALAAALQKAGPDAVPAVISALKERDVDIEAEVVLLLRFWAIYDPAAATDYASHDVGVAIRPLAISAAVEEWASRNPQEAAKGTHDLRANRGVNAEMAETALMRGWFDSGSFAGLEKFLLSLGPSFEQQRCVRAFARRMIQRAGAEAAEQWAEAIPDDPYWLKMAAFRQVAIELTRSDPALGVAWCEKQCAGPHGRGIRVLVASNWADVDGQAAMEWISKTPPDDPDFKLAVGTAYRRWLQKDPDGATHWLASIGTKGLEPWMKPAVALYAVKLAETDPEQALEWAKFAEDDQKVSLLINIGRIWRRHDPAAADAWIDRSPLTEEQRKLARSKPARPRPHRPEAPEAPAS